MTMLRMKLNGEWVDLYAGEIKNRLKRTENLADLDDASAARQNLELTGDVSTHNHDSRYLSLIENMNSGASGNSALIEKEREDRIAEDAKINQEIDNLEKTLESSLTALKNETKRQIEEVDNKLQNLKTGIMSTRATVTGSTGGAASILMNTEETAGDNNQIIKTSKFYTTTDGIPSTTDELEKILQQLVTLSHRHDTDTITSTSECNCSTDCDCNCKTNCNCCGH